MITPYTYISLMHLSTSLRLCVVLLMCCRYVGISVAVGQRESAVDIAFAVAAAEVRVLILVALLYVCAGSRMCACVCVRPCVDACPFASLLRMSTCLVSMRVGLPCVHVGVSAVCLCSSRFRLNIYRYVLRAIFMALRVSSYLETPVYVSMSVCGCVSIP